MSRQKKQNTYHMYTYEDGNAVRRLEAVPDYQEERRRRKEERRISEQKRRRRRAARRNRERALKMSAGYALFLSVCISVTAFTSVIFVKMQSDLLIHRQGIVALESEIAALKENNDAAYKRMVNTADLKGVKKQAKQFGMKYPSRNQIIYYSIENSDYMAQYSE